MSEDEVEGGSFKHHQISYRADALTGLVTTRDELLGSGEARPSYDAPAVVFQVATKKGIDSPRWYHIRE